MSDEDTGGGTGGRAWEVWFSTFSIRSFNEDNEFSMLDNNSKVLAVISLDDTGSDEFAMLAWMRVEVFDWLTFLEMGEWFTALQL